MLSLTDTSFTLFLDVVSGQCSLHYEGNEFIIMLIETAKPTEDPKLFVSSPSTSEVVVTIETPVFGKPFTKTIVLYPRRTHVIVLPNELIVTGTTVEKKGILVRSTDDIILSMQQGLCGTFTVIPVTALGDNYLVMSWWHGGAATSRGQIGIIATEDNTHVRAIIPLDVGVILTYNGIDYNETQPLELVLNKFETVHLQSANVADVTGTKIEANNKVAVFSAVVSTTAGNSDDIVQEMTPIHAAGTTFVLVGFHEEVIGYRFRVMSVHSNTTVTISGNETYLSHAGQYTDHSRSSAEPVGISADKPVIVAEFSESKASGTPGGPSMVLIPPTQQYRNEYTFTVPMPSTVYNSSYLMLIIEGGQEDQIFMDGNQVQGQRVDIVDTSPQLVGVTTAVSSGRHHIYHQSHNVKFGLYIYGTASGVCAFSFVAGMCLDDIRQVGGLYENCPKYIYCCLTSVIVVSENDYDVLNFESLCVVLSIRSPIVT